MNLQSLFPLRSVTVMPAPRARVVRTVVALRPGEFLMRVRETHRVARVQTHSPMMRPSALMRSGGRS